jgi:hypothetical protein
MPNKDRDFERANEPRDANPGVGADDRVEELRGTADDEADEFEVTDDEDMDVDEEQEEGTF